MIHLAGPRVEIGDYVGQRCVICGMPFDDGPLDGSGRGMSQEGGFYEFIQTPDGRKSQRLVGMITPPYEFPLLSSLPESCCIHRRMNS